jgi:hypothetical protein
MTLIDFHWRLSRPFQGAGCVRRTFLHRERASPAPYGGEAGGIGGGRDDGP